MFDRIIVPRSGPVTHYQNITEKRAPTDESVALLRDMEDRAERRIVEATRVGNTDFECVLHSIKDPVSGDVVLRAIFSLGGRNFSVIHRAHSVSEDALEGLIGEISKKIAIEIVRPALKSLTRR